MIVARKKRQKSDPVITQIADAMSEGADRLIGTAAAMVSTETIVKDGLEATYPIPGPWHAGRVIWRENGPIHEA